MAKLIKYKLPALLNAEYPIVIKQMVETIRKYNLEKLYLLSAYNRIVDFMPQLEHTKKQERKNKINTLMRQNNALFNTIYKIAKQFCAVNVYETNKSANKIMAIFKKYKMNIYNVHLNIFIKCGSKLIYDIESDPGVMESMHQLSLISIYNRLKSNIVEFETFYREDNIDLRNVKKINIRELRRKCDKAVILFGKALEYNMEESGSDDYLPLCNDLNKINAYYKNLTENRKLGGNKEMGSFNQ